MNAIVTAARDWVGTPYVHQQSRKKAGCDCLGLLRGIWREVIGPEPTVIPAYSMDWSEPQGEERLWGAALKYLLPSTGLEPVVGEVMLFRMRAGSVAKHLGIQGRVGTNPSFIHAYAGRGVVESPLSEPWRRRIVARFQFPHGG